jgi:Protein of unknown function (DUF2852)
MTSMAGDTASAGAPGGAGDWRRDAWSGQRRGSCGWSGGGMRPLEIVAMVLGFIVFWPIGLAILLMQVWKRRWGYSGDMMGFAQERWSDLERGVKRGAGWPPAWGPRGMRATGNVHFDAWKAAEIDRLEQERRKLEAAQREFADYLDHLRQARDREEFDRFKHERDAAKARGETGWRPFDNGEPRKDA